jgi:hypothetical protein
MQDLHIEVRDQDIVVTMPSTNLRVVYRKPHRGSQLLGPSYFMYVSRVTPRSRVISSIG